MCQPSLPPGGLPQKVSNLLSLFCYLGVKWYEERVFWVTCPYCTVQIEWDLWVMGIWIDCTYFYTNPDRDSRADPGAWGAQGPSWGKVPQILDQCPLYFSGSYFLMINPSTFFNWGARRPPTPPPCIFLCLGSVHYLPTPNFFWGENGSTLLKKNADKMVMDDPWSPYSPCTGENDPVGVKLFFWLRAIPTKEYGGGRQEWNCPNKNWNKVNYLVLNIFNPQRSVIPFVIF